MHAPTHTPGPWYFKVQSGPHQQGLIISENDGRNIAATYDSKDARLIAAAPQMLEALRAALEAMGDTYDARDAAGTEGEQLHNQITEAIAAATGEEGGAK